MEPLERHTWKSTAFPVSTDTATNPYDSAIMRILIADDSAPVRQSMRALFESRSGWKICGEADNGEAAIEKTQELKPDVVVLDLAMPLVNGFIAAKIIKETSPDTAILLYSVYYSATFENEARKLRTEGM